jgi:hypothetical protein
VELNESRRIVEEMLAAAAKNDEEDLWKRFSWSVKLSLLVFFKMSIFESCFVKILSSFRIFSHIFSHFQRSDLFYWSDFLPPNFIFIAASYPIFLLLLSP